MIRRCRAFFSHRYMLDLETLRNSTSLLYSVSWDDDINTTEDIGLAFFAEVEEDEFEFLFIVDNVRIERSYV